MDWGSAVGGFLAGLAGGYTLKVFVDARRNTRITDSQNKDSQGHITQQGNVAGGDFAGRDINKRSQ